VEVDGPAHTHHQPLRNRKTQSAALIELIPRIFQRTSVQIHDRYASHQCVPYIHIDRKFIFPERQTELLAVIAILNAVRDQIVQHAVQRLIITEAINRMIRDLDMDEVTSSIRMS